MKIYWIKAQAPLRVLALAKHLGMPFEAVNISGKLRSEDYTRLNPNQKAPVLVDGDFVLWESVAIMAHLCIKAGSSMWPAHAPSEQVEVLRWIGWNGAQWEPAVGPFYFEHIVKKTFGLGQPDAAEIAKALPDLRRWATVLNDHLSKAPYVACGRLTIADFQLASMARYWRETETPFGEFPHIVRWLDRLMELPAWANPWPA